MKYPQLVSMPLAVQDWLDEQLEARGIDAVVYTRYILSLLQRDTLDLSDDFLAVSSNKAREVGRRGRKRGRNREEYWDVWDCEQLKRSAAVECLMSASDQKCGIEKLVDELCAKLKEIQSEGEKSSHLEFPSEAVSSKLSHIPSPQDQVQKYYAAFPPLNSKFAESSSSLITVVPGPSSAWNSKKVLANSFGKNKPCYTSLQAASSREEKMLVGTTGWGEENKENRAKNNLWKEFGRESMKCGSQTKENAKSNKEAVFGYVWNMAGEWNGSCADFYPGGDCGSSGSDFVRIFHCNRQNKENKACEDEMMGKELQGHRESGCEDGVCRRLYERQTGDGNFMSPGSVTSEKEELQNGRTAGDGDRARSTSPGQSTEDQNLALLIAKFDHSIEALWDPAAAATASPCSVPSEEPLDSNQVLPLNFHKVLSSPNNQYFTVELYNFNTKRNMNVFPNNNSFIQCGTNITSSIWSDHPSMVNSIEQDEFGMDYTQLEQRNTSDPFGESKVTVADMCYNEVEMVTDKYAPHVTGEGKIVGSKFCREEQLKANKFEEVECSNSSFKNADVREIGTCDVPISEEKSKVTWRTYDSFSSFFTSLPWTVNCAVSDNAQGPQTEKVSGGMSSGTSGSYPHFGRIFSNVRGSTSNCTQSPTDVLSDSLITLNHNREDSSFTEVIPKQNSLCGLLAGKLDARAAREKKETLSAERARHLDAEDVAGSKGGKSDVEREDEDLLTSTRTHFRPIRTESVDSHLSLNTCNNNNVGCYADGTTFVIPTSLEEVAFKRSESGTLYLEAEADAGPETANRYMEYKEKEPYGGRHRFERQSHGVDNSREFIPKFRVHQNEKWCQTEAEDDALESDDEGETKRIRQGNDSATNAEDFYFPYDDHFAEKIINSLEDSSENTTEIVNRKSYSACHLEKNVHMSRNSSSLRQNSCLQHDNNAISSLGSAPLNGIVPKIPSNSSCMCSCNSYHLQMWKTAWPRSSQAPRQSVWEATESDGPQSWYNIWKMSPGPLGHLCKYDMLPPVGVVLSQSFLGKETDGGGTDNRSLQYSRLREELTVEGEQLLSDLRYMQHLYQGSDWQEDAAEAQGCMEDWGPEQEETDGDQTFGYLSQEVVIYTEDAADCTHIVAAGHPLEKERKSVDDFGTSYSAVTSPSTPLLSADPEEDWKPNERPLNAMAIQKDRKRRHSASQRACGYYLEGSCRRPHCRLSRDLAAVPCRFWADSSCLKGIACPFLHGSAQAVRPVTL